MTTTNPPAVVSAAMGYGHLRAAMPLCEVLGQPLLRADAPPLADAREHKLWSWLLRGHSLLSKPIRVPLRESPLGNLGMDWLTQIEPLYPKRNQSRPDLGTLAIDRLLSLGLGRGVVELLRGARVPLITTFYAPALAADLAGVEEIYCIVTDSDAHRVWVARNPAESRIHYFAPCYRVVRRLRAYGVSSTNITLTGFRLPPALVSSDNADSARARLAERIVRLDPEGSFRNPYSGELERVLGEMPKAVVRPLRLVFAVGGAGTQVEVAGAFLRSLGDWIRDDRLEVTLVAGMRESVANRLRRSVDDASLGTHLGGRVRVLYERDFESYYAAFNATLASADILWTKPSELTFYAALGLPLVVSPPVGTHERHNRRYLRRLGAGLDQERPNQARGWLGEWLADGSLAGAAWSGFLRMPRAGTWKISEAVTTRARLVADSCRG